jgi:two-component system KDP operon response regulator KdpE
VNGSGPPIVIVEDEQPIRRFLRAALEAEGYRVFEAEGGQAGLDQAAANKPVLMILDLGLPDIDGLEVIRHFRVWSQSPILVLSARTTEPDKVAALDLGADDYLVKPFGVAELVARVRALLRRPAGSPGDAEVCFGDVRVDLAGSRVWRNGEAVHLSSTEFRLLATLIAHAGKVLTHRMLLSKVWGGRHGDSNHYVRIYVARLRQKLEQDAARPRHFITETGVGYRFQTE